MKTNAMRTLAAGLFLMALMFIGCKKAETGPAGAQGPQGATGQGLTGTNSGFVTGTVTGTRRDGTPFSETFNYTYYFGNDSGSLDSSAANNYNFSLSRGVNDIFSSNYANISMMTTSKTAPTGTISSLNFGFEKSLGSNKMFVFSGYVGMGSATSLSYNASTGLFSGNFTTTIPGSSNNTTNTATLTGNFQANVVQQVYRKQQESAIKIN